MNPSFIALVLSSLWIVEGFNITDGKNKTKRNLSGDIQNYGESNIVWLNSDRQPSIVRNTNPYFPNGRSISLVGVQKIPTEQVLYEFEQAPPTNAVPSVNLKLFQPPINVNQEVSGQVYKPLLQNPNSGSPSNFNQESVVPAYKPFLQNNGPSVITSSNLNQELAGQAYKTFPQTNAPGVISPGNFNQELTAQAYKAFPQSNAPGVLSSVNLNHELAGQASYKPFVQNNAHNVVGSETIVSPIQHSHLVQNNINPYSNVRVHPLYNIQPQFVGQKKYIYVNGKLIHDPNNLQSQNPLTFYHSNQQFPQRQPIINYINHNGVPRQNLVPPPPITQNRFQAPPKSQLQPIDTPSATPQKTERQERPTKPRAEERPTKPRAEERPTKPMAEERPVEEDNEEYNQREDDSDNYERSHHESYSFDDDDEDDHLSLREHEDIEDDDDEDSNRGSTRYVPSKVNKHPKKFYKSGKKDEITYGSRYSHPEKKGSAKKHTMRYKSYKFSKDSDQQPGEGIEGRQSQHIPVTHKHKIFKEKWYLSKSSADGEGFDD